MSKMTVIQLLNKIANGENIPKKVKWGIHIFKLCEGTYINYFETIEFNGGKRYKTLEDYLDYDYKSLNEEVEILEEEPRDIEVCGSLFTKSEYDRLAHSGEEKKIPEKIIKLYAPYPECEDTRFEEVENKINEIIDYLKSKGE